jgi:L-threonylcarbamoyladenylate synthase
MARIVPATEEWIDVAAEVINSGGLVAFPTETVYGLGANAHNSGAVAKIFDAKGRPSTNPIIVHVGSVDQLRDLCETVPDAAYKLAKRFWPGPMTLVLPKSETVPGIVTAGGSTVGVRVPNHPVALALIKAAGVPIAAPSANRSEEVSPTTAQHVADSLGDAIDLILDGGPCEVGIESTVLDLSSDAPKILRPGSITAAQIEAVLGVPVHLKNPDNNTEISLSPGRMPRHYAPKKPMTLFSWTPDVMDALPRMFPREKLGVFGLTQKSLSWTRETAKQSGCRLIQLSRNPNGYARQLYAVLHDFDNDPDIISIEVEEPPDMPEWAAVRDRLKRASSPKE